MCWISSELASSHHPSAMNNEDATGTANPLATIHAAILPQAPPTMPSVISQTFPSTQEVSHCNQVNVSNNEQDNAETPHILGIIQPSLRRNVTRGLRYCDKNMHLPVIESDGDYNVLPAFTRVNIFHCKKNKDTSMIL
jgi:hypothetical protein